MNEDKKIAITILARLYEEKYFTSEYDYETVDSFYAYLGYDLGLTEELPKLGINGTGELQEALLHAGDVALNSLSDEELKGIFWSMKEFRDNILAMIDFRNENSDEDDQQSTDDAVLESYFVEEVRNGVYTDTFL